MMLMLLVFILGFAGMTFFVNSLNGASVQIERNKKTFQSLAEAKTALIGWSVSHPNLPGMMPWPDRGSGGGYDGNSDCATVAFHYNFLIGKLPWVGQTSPCVNPRTGVGIDARDGDGERLWYVVSRNLVHDYETGADPEVSPSIIDNPAHPWMIVQDKQGNVVSNRVAAIIISPGFSLGGQDRSGGTAGPGEYLDSFKIGAIAFSNNSYTLPDESFVMGEHYRSVRNDDTVYQHPYYFNDKLAYITIDELMTEIEKRVAGEVRSVLAGYNNKTGHFPYAAQLGSGDYSSVMDNYRGMLPVDITDTCSCSSSSNCSCGFSLVGNVSFKRSGSSVWSDANISGACSRPTTQTCTCTGAGYCRNATGSRDFTCDSAGNCTTNSTGTYTYPPPSYGKISSASGGCGLSGNKAVCSASGWFGIGLKVPPWFSTNNWRDYFYYHWSSTAGLQVGSRGNVEAVIISVGKTIADAPYPVKGSAQSRPSGSIYDYLDSTENADGDLVYDATNTASSKIYNDLLLIVAPE